MATTKKITDAEEVKTPKVEKTSKTGGFSVTTYSLIGKEAGSLELPKSIFDGEVNKALIAQAIRVYTNNEKGHFSNTKTRGEVTGSTRKIYKQKGTGRARHGSIMAPIFVGGGIALGPKSRITNMELPKKMKKAALVAALREKFTTKELSGIELGSLSGKTKEVSGFLKGVNKKTALVIVDGVNEMVQRATSNLKGLSVMTTTEINVFEIIKHQSIFMTKEAVSKLEERLSNKKDEETKK
jgi:large subunit ribosomal protein L4